MVKIIDGKKISCEIREALSAFLKQNKSKRPPHLGVILVGDDPASLIYVENKKRICEKTGIKISIHRFKQRAAQREISGLISKLNVDKKVDGILIQMPLPAHLDKQILIEQVVPEKDVDCFHPYNIGKLIQGSASMPPCTPSGIIELLKRYGINCAGKNAVIVGRSQIVGKPVAIMLLQRDATVTICHSKTKNIKEMVKGADVLIAAIGKPHFIKGDWIKKGATVIDVGISRMKDKIVGDVEFEKAKTRAGYITPVPGGVGPMTIAMLIKNIITAYRLNCED